MRTQKTTFKVIRTGLFLLVAFVVSVFLSGYWLPRLGFVTDNDADGDGLPNTQEIQIGTNPANADTDGDGLKDGWEVFGVVPALTLPAGNLEPVALPHANPLRKDIYVEVDWMRDATHTHEFRRAARDRVEDAFTRAPVANPSGEYGVDIHIDTGQFGGGGDEIEHLAILPVGTGYLQVPGVGDLGQGAGVAIGNIDNNAAPDMVIMAYDNPAGPNSFRYRIGWNLNRDGIPTTWSGAPNTPWSSDVQVTGVGDEGQGAGCRLLDLDGNGRPELILMAYDNPAGANSFRYMVGLNLNVSGVAASWSGSIQVSGVGNEGQGAGVACTNLDANARPEMVFMAYDNPAGPNSFRYKVGWNVNAAGVAASWSAAIQVDGVGNEGQGADLDFVDLDANGRPEMILMAYDNPAGGNTYRYRLGWNLSNTGVAAEWQPGLIIYPGTGNEGEGAGLAVANLDGLRTDLLLLSYDAPSGPNSFRYNIAYNLDAAGNAVHYDYYKQRFFNPARAGIYHYCIYAHDYWRGGSSSGLSFSTRDFIVTLGSWTGQTGTDNDQSGAFMHELGHNLGLGHGGNSGVNNKPNYPSIMNYNNTYTVDIDYDGAIDGPLDYSHGFLTPLNENALNENLGVAAFVSSEGVGNESQGADLAVWDLDSNGIQDLLLLAYDAPAGPNNVRYKIGYDVTPRAVPRRWTNGFVLLPGMGDEGQGAGVELADLNGNGRPEMIVMVYDNPAGQNNLRYRIGWDLNTRGETSNWSRTYIVDGMGWEGQGLSIVVSNIDADSRPDLIVSVYDNPAGPNNFRYKIGWNLSPGGAVSSWSGITVVNGAGDEGQGEGLALTNLDANARPEMLLMAYDNPAGPNTFRVRIGWNLNASGIAASWSDVTIFAGVGDEGQGAGIRLFDANANGRPEMILLAYDNPSGPNTFRFRVGRDLTTTGGLGQPFGFPRDWNGSGTFENAVMVNINGDLDNLGNPVFGVLTDWNDWANLVY
ncbi:MAG: M66 family metalloprotease [bacterium]